MSISQLALDNITIIIDYNNMQFDGSNQNVMSLMPLNKKLEAFGFSVIEVNGHGIGEIRDAFNAQANGMPKAIIAYTIKATFAFWIRRASLLSLKDRFMKNNGSDTSDTEGFLLGRGLAFHIAPSNVPVNFAFSLVSGLICGNINIVRVPTKQFPQVDIITKAINTVLQSHTEMLLCLQVQLKIPVVMAIAMRD